MNKIVLVLLSAVLFSCTSAKQTIAQEVTSKKAKDFVWEGANLYFLMIDRFNNGDISNDNPLQRNLPTGKYRNFMGGDLRGIIQKIDDGYFENLGINAIWLTPVVEQIHGSVDEGTGNTYGYHGYWTKDWTAIDPNFGTKTDLKELVDKAHQKGIRIMLDAVINHTGPVTALDPAYPSDWVRTTPKCTYNSYDNYINCTLVENLPDVLTESNQAVALPEMLIAKWKKEGRYEQEVKELDDFFARTEYPRAPKYYIMKWLSDYIADYGIDGYRVDTAKHVTEEVWADFAKVCKETFLSYKQNHPNQVLDDAEFYLLGEVYGYGLHGKRIYDFGDRKVDYFANGFDNLINFDFKGDANKDFKTLFAEYNSILHTDLQSKNVMNYISSHDDSGPYDRKREKTIEGGTKLLLTSGIAQIYYGDESARQLEVNGCVGDANLRSPMNWKDIKQDERSQKVLGHYQKIGQFRKHHPAVGAGIHHEIEAPYYTFSRTWGNDKVVIALNVPVWEKEIKVGSVFADGTKVRDAYSGLELIVQNGKVQLDTPFDIVLLEIR
jgi:alpha-amylase